MKEATGKTKYIVQGVNNMNLVKCIAFLIFIGCSSQTRIMAQQSVVSSGGEVSASSGSFSYSIGQTLYLTNSNSGISIAEGVQQAYEISIISEIVESNNMQIKLSVYPNPTQDFLTLTVDLTSIYDFNKIEYQLYDLSGKLLDNNQLSEKDTRISMLDFAPAVYYLKISNESQELALFKIIKNQ